MIRLLAGCPWGPYVGINSGDRDMIDTFHTYACQTDDATGFICVS